MRRDGEGQEGGWVQGGVVGWEWGGGPGVRGSIMVDAGHIRTYKDAYMDTSKETHKDKYNTSSLVSLKSPGEVEAGGGGGGGRGEGGRGMTDIDLREIEAVIVDEVHILKSQRGP